MKKHLYVCNNEYLTSTQVIHIKTGQDSEAQQSPCACVCAWFLVGEPQKQFWTTTKMFGSPFRELILTLKSILLEASISSIFVEHNQF